jgi:hypothetical protein
VENEDVVDKPTERILLERLCQFPAMKRIFTTKISLQSSNRTHSYPIIRLPRALKDLAGKTVDIYEVEKNGSLAFFLMC